MKNIRKFLRFIRALLECIIPKTNRQNKKQD